MKNYGIIAAMQEEMQEIQKLMKEISTIEIYELNGDLNIVIANSFNKSKCIDRRNEKGYSTKGKGRGNGLYFASKMINKCDWLVDAQSINNDFYIQKLIIKIKKA